MEEKILQNADCVMIMEDQEKPMYYITLGKNAEGKEVVISHRIMPGTRQHCSIEEFNAGKMRFEKPCQILINPEVAKKIDICRPMD